jgi:predicted TIM-barrel fold metal-dependent hydrolase
VNRRSFLKTSAIALAGSACGASEIQQAAAERRHRSPAKIIDTHTHFFDPTRPEGVPWPSKNDELLYRRTMPEDFRKVAVPLGVTGTVVVEASPWLEDNQWILDLAESEPLIVGFVGHLNPGEPDFGKHVDRFAKNRLFRGIRPRGRGFAGIEDDQACLADLRRLASADLTLDVVGGPQILASVVQLSRRIPKLRIVIDHLPFNPPRDLTRRKQADEAIQALADRPNVFAKVSNVLRRVDGRVPTDAEFYRRQLDLLWRRFGADRVFYGSNWPVSERVGPYVDVLQVVMDYVSARGERDAEKYFWKNSLAAYRWVERA